MFSKKQLVILSLLSAIVFHFVFYLNEYGPGGGVLNYYIIFSFAFVSIVLIAFVYLATRWRVDLRGSFEIWIFEMLMVWIVISLIRSLLQINTSEEFKSFFLSSYLAIAFFPMLFLLVGLNAKYFYSINRIVFFYTICVTIFSLPFVSYFELMLFLTFPIFFVITTIPLRSFPGKLVIIIISLTVILVSLTNRAGILRILLSFSVVIGYYIITYAKMGKKWLSALVFVILMIPVVSLYLGVKGQSVFQLALGDSNSNYNQLDPYADTRTFLYYEVFQDIKNSNSFIFGKGMNAGYYSEAFQTYQRPVVEVGFLQILLKTGVIGLILYLTLIITAIFKALSRSNNNYIKSLGLLLVGYIIMVFIENQIAFNLLNVMIWMVIGMCLSRDLRKLDDQEIKRLFVVPYNRFSEKRRSGTSNEK